MNVVPPDIDQICSCNGFVDFVTWGLMLDSFNLKLLSVHISPFKASGKYLLIIFNQWSKTSTKDALF